MKTADFDYDLPKSFIAQEPLIDRPSAKMMVLNRKDKSIEHKTFYDILDYLKDGDVIVRNNTKVLPARLFGTKKITNAWVEVLLLKQIDLNTWECLVGNAKVVKIDTEITFSDELECKCKEVKDEGIRILEFKYEGNFFSIIDKIGLMPLPPYIKKKLEDNSLYQTTYAKVLGSAAAPTAGFHFTNELFENMKEKGVTVVDVTLNVGLGTFRPVDVEDVTKHVMHTETYSVSKEAADSLNKAKEEGRRIIALGTTSVRTLEANFAKQNKFIEEDNVETNIFIYPGYTFKALDGIITNFHLPKSTLLMLVSAFAGKEYIMNAYEEAKKNNYRFFSFGDGMLIL